MSKLVEEKCVAVNKGDPPLTPAEVDQLKPQVPDWNIYLKDGVPHLERVFTFKDFNQALAFTDQVGRLADAENHHPAILTEWGKVTVTLWTHRINGLHRNDFILAAKTDQLKR